METKIGNLGLKIPVQSISGKRALEFTPASMTAWRNSLPMADTGATAQKIYHALCDCNQVELKLDDRFQILELLRTPVQFISQSLRKHYHNQTEGLNEKKLTIVKFAQTLQLEMANGYKLILEQLAEKPSSDDFKRLAHLAIERILHYFDYILLRCYNLYSTGPNEIWKEIYILYQFSEQHHLLEKSVSNSFKHIFIMSCANPYKWRQSEQDALFHAIELWTKDIILSNALKKDKPGQYFFEIGTNEPPRVYNTTIHIQNEKNCRNVNLEPVVAHLKSLISIIEPDELHARIEHSNDPEYALSLPVLQGLVQEWNTMPIRTTERISKTEAVNICIGLSSVHYYVSGETPFVPPQEGISASSLGSLPSLSIQEETSIDTKSVETIEFTQTALPLEAKKAQAYPSYQTTEINESKEGYCLIWKGENYPPIQAGELIGIKNEEEAGSPGTEGKPIWNAAMIRWLKHTEENQLLLGIKRLSNTVQAASAQIIKEGNPAGYFLRCLVMDTGILTPTIPFKTGSQVFISKLDGSSEEVELLKLRSATGSYKLFDYRSKDKTKIDGLETKGPGTPETQQKPTEKKPEKKGDFDSIWSHL